MKSVKIQGCVIFCDFIQVFVFTTNDHLNSVMKNDWTEAVKTIKTASSRPADGMKTDLRSH